MQKPNAGYTDRTATNRNRESSTNQNRPAAGAQQNTQAVAEKLCAAARLIFSR